PVLSSVSIGVAGSTTLCTSSSGGTAAVTDIGGDVSAQQWAYRTSPGGVATPIGGENGVNYVIKGASFPGPGFYYLVCVTVPSCGVPTYSNEVFVTVNGDAMAPSGTA